MGEPDRALTSVGGVAVGHADDPAARTGCTVVLGPFRAAAEVRGQATGSREMDVVRGDHVVRRVDALLLTGGSAFGLGAADGVAGWLEERGRGFETPAARVPIVPAAVLYDLGVGDPDVRPGPAMGREAASAAGPGEVREGRVGAGIGATVGKLRGIEGADPGGVGTWAERHRGRAVGALAVVNAFGDVLDGAGRGVAGARDPGAGGGHLDTARALREGPPPEGARWGAGRNTTLVAVGTDRPLSRSGLRGLARQAMNGVVRRVRPSSTPFDGDVAFAFSTGGVRASGAGGSPEELPGVDELVALGAVAQEVTERAVERAVRAAAAGEPS